MNLIEIAVVILGAVGLAALVLNVFLETWDSMRGGDHHG